MGIRLSPYGASNGLTAYDGLEETYARLANTLSEIGIAYIHIVDHSALGAPAVTRSVKAVIRQNFNGAVILAGGYDRDRAEQDLNDGKGDLVAFGRPFIANPNLVEKLADRAVLTAPDPGTFYTPGEKGYLDYQVN